MTSPMVNDRAGPAESDRRKTLDVVVVGGGVAGLTIADALVSNGPRHTVLVLEAADRPGGQIVTTSASGYTVEHGASAIMGHQPATAALIGRLGLAGRVQPAAGAARRTGVWVRGELRWLPRSVGEAFSTELLSRVGLLRAFAEPVLGRQPRAGDCSVHDFAARRFGTEFAEVVAAAFVQGVTAGDARTTSLKGLSSRLHELDQSAGVGGLAGRVLRTAMKGRGNPRPAVRRPATLRDGGLGVLPDTLATRLGDQLECGRPVRLIERGRVRRWAVLPEVGEPVEADTVVLAVPAFRAAALVHEVAPAAADLLGRISYTDLRMVALGFRRDAFPVLPRGFGFLAPPGAGLDIIGAVISSNAFPEQAPPGRVLVRTFLGGIAHPEAIDLPPADALDLVMRELRRTLDVREDPESVWDVPWRKSLPQPTLGHPGLVDRIERELAACPGLHLAGNSYHGVGLDDTIRTAVRFDPHSAAHRPEPTVSGGYR